MGLRDLPLEIIVLVYQRLDSTRDAHYLAQSCKLSYIVFNVPYNRGKIFESILDNIISAAAPSKAWLEACFGANTLWQITESDLDGLVHGRTRDFLLNVGFPAVKLDGMAFESTYLTQDPESNLKHYVLTDENDLEMHLASSCPPTRCDDIYFHFGNVNECKIMVDAEYGDVWLYEPDHLRYAGAGHYFYDAPWNNTVAWSLDSFAMLLGMVVVVARDLRAAPWRSFPWGFEARKQILDTLRARINECDYVVAEDTSGFWDDLFEKLIGQ
ncbi:hypothetical protein BDV26DRAFT_264590 [Aspergillus bertholletiae]|uniref:Uncharacterized protein n=1 Tax=Aspergillus bertholletiae TaxID=1226010 RepID=A0A5N7B6I2_9EURO|nr:hypothetical protein BDV26DRAFT_264590 [Aspergillus bertholletiae]